MLRVDATIMLAFEFESAVVWVDFEVVDVEGDVPDTDEVDEDIWLVDEEVEFVAVQLFDAQS